jgi:hypothetical protein
MCTTEAGAAARRDRLQNEQIFLDRCGRDKPAVARRDKQNCAAGTWLSVFQNWLNGNGLPAIDWRDNVRLRCNHSPLNMPAARDGCRAKMTVEHALSCKTGGLPLKTNKLIYWIKILLRYSYWISDALFLF